MPDIDFAMPADADERWGSTSGEKLHDEIAARIIAKRLGIPGSEAASGRGRESDRFEVALKLVQLIPEQLRTQNVLERLDLRTLLVEVMGTEFQAEQRGDITVNGQTFTPKQQAAAAGMYVYFKRELKSSIETQLADAGVSPEAIADIAFDEISRWQDERKTLIPVPAYTGQVLIDPATGQTQTAGANTALDDALGAFYDIANSTGPTQQAPAFMTPEDIALLFRDETANTAIGAYMGDLAQRQAAAAAGVIPAAPPDRLIVEMTARTEDGTPGPYQRPGSTPQQKNQARYGSESYSLTQALSLPMTMSRVEIQRLSDKMKKAGIFDQVGGEPLVKGDPTDPQFKDAYRLLLAKSIQLGRPVSTVLDEQMAAYEDAVEENARARLTDPNRLRITGDNLGRQTLGRKLTNAEHASLQKFIHDLEIKQARTEADEDGGDVVDVDWEARMLAEIEARNPGEMGAHDVAAQTTQFRSMLGPGGRG